MTKEQAYREDETTRFKEIMRRDENEKYWADRMIRAIDKNINIPTPPTPKYVKVKKQKWSKTASVGFRTAIRGLIP